MGQDPQDPRFLAALAYLRRVEGGDARVPGDRGGPTRCGVTQTVYTAWRRAHGQPWLPITSMTDTECADLYAEQYWTAGHCPDLPPALALCHFDGCVHCGVAQGVRLLQRALGVHVDGVFGPATRTAVSAMPERRAVGRYLAARVRFYLADVARHPRDAQFLRGWFHRLRTLRAASRRLLVQP